MTVGTQLDRDVIPDQETALAGYVIIASGGA